MAPDNAIENEEPDELTPDELVACEHAEDEGLWYPLEEVLAELGL